MRVLGLETSTLTGGVACVADGVVLAEGTLDVRQTHTAVLLPAVDRVLGDAGWRIDDVDAFGVALGPGSFTSLRIGLATAKGLAARGRRPVAGVETLRAMAWGVPCADVLVAPVIDARRGEHYAAHFRWRAGGLEPEGPPRVGALADLFAEVREPVCCPGDLDDVLRDRIAATTGHPVYVPHPRLPGARPSAVAFLAAALVARGVLPPVEALTPLYLRDHLGRKPAA